MRTSTSARVMPALPDDSSGAIESNAACCESQIEEEVCAICLDQVEDIRVALECNHRFHATCIHTWWAMGRSTCPMCKGHCSGAATARTILLKAAHSKVGGLYKFRTNRDLPYYAAPLFDTRLEAGQDTTVLAGDLVTGNIVEGGEFVRTVVTVQNRGELYCFLPLRVDGQVALELLDKLEAKNVAHMHNMVLPLHDGIEGGEEWEEDRRSTTECCSMKIFSKFRRFLQ